jgi:hypothetical protein
MYLVLLGLILWRVLRAIIAGRSDQRGADRFDADGSGTDQPGAAG